MTTLHKTGNWRRYCSLSTTFRVLLLKLSASRFKRSLLMHLTQNFATQVNKGSGNIQGNNKGIDVSAQGVLPVDGRRSSPVERKRRSQNCLRDNSFSLDLTQ